MSSDGGGFYRPCATSALAPVFRRVGSWREPVGVAMGLQGGPAAHVVACWGAGGAVALTWMGGVASLCLPDPSAAGRFRRRRLRAAGRFRLRRRRAHPLPSASHSPPAPAGHLRPARPAPCWARPARPRLPRSAPPAVPASRRRQLGSEPSWRRPRAPGLGGLSRAGSLPDCQRPCWVAYLPPLVRR